MTHHIGWSEPRVALLRKHWSEGFSASQIAKLLSGTTRNAVIGKVHRMGLPRRAEPNRKLHSMPPKRRQRAEPSPPRLLPAKALPLASDLKRVAALSPIEPALTVLGLTNFTCRYPIGDPTDADFSFCGRTCNNIENPYCVQHQKLAYVPAQKKKRKHEETARLANWMDRRTFKAAA